MKNKKDMNTDLLIRKEHETGGYKSWPSRGYRNNNPLNIKHGTSHWLGMRTEQKDTKFVQFESMEMGYRAACILLLNYRQRYNLKTIRQIIGRWAPRGENNTYVYIFHVCEWMKIPDPDHEVTTQELPALIGAMSRQENGVEADMKQVKAGITLALQSSKQC